MLKQACRRMRLVPCLILVAHLATMAFVPAQDPPAPWSLQGRFVDGAGKPVSGVRVGILGATAEAEISFSGLRDPFVRQADSIQSRVEREVVTDKSGRYELSDIVHRAVNVRFSMPDGRVTIVPAISATTKRSPGPTLIPDAEIWAGTLRDAKGNGIEGVGVFAMADMRGRGRPTFYVTARTNKEGAFRLPLESRSEYDITALHPEFVLPRAFKVHDFTRRRAKGSRDLGSKTVVKRVSVGGRLVDRDGRPVADVKVAAAIEETTLMTDVTTAPDGSFSFEGAAADFRAHIALRDAAWCIAPDQSSGLGRWRYREGVGQFDSEESNIRGKVIQLVAVRSSSATGIVVDASTKQPIVGARVEVMMQNASGHASTVLTDESGRYLLKSLPIGKAQLVVWHPNYMPHQASSWSRRGQNAYGSAPRMVLEPGKVHEMPVAEMVPAWIVDGRVTDQVGNPVAGATVSYVEPTRGMESLMLRFFPEKRATSDSEGRYRMRGVAPLASVADLIVMGPMRAKGSRRIHLPEMKREGLVIQGVDIALRQGIRVAGIVIGVDGKPAPSVDLIFVLDREDLPDGPENQIRGTISRTDSEGRFVALLNHAGRYTIQRHGRYDRVTRTSDPEATKSPVEPAMTRHQFQDGDKKEITLKLVAAKPPR